MTFHLIFLYVLHTLSTGWIMYLNHKPVSPIDFTHKE